MRGSSCGLERSKFGADDVQMWAEETEDHQVSLVLYCEKLTPILKEDTDKVWWALSMLVDQTIGEVSAIAFVAGFDVYAQPKDEPPSCFLNCGVAAKHGTFSLAGWQRLPGKQLPCL